jgi:Peptidase A4 family
VRPYWCLLIVCIGAGIGASVGSAAAEVSPGVLSVGASPRTIPAGGGSVLVTARVRGATSCRFTGRSFDVTVPCSSGSARVGITLAPNLLENALQLRYSLRVRGNGGLSAATHFVVTEAALAPQADVDTLPLAVSAATAPLPTDLSGTVNLHSTNWSGYSAIGGPFTVATGSFSVPSLTPTPAPATTSEWVGIDGGPGHRGLLIQAGVTESYDASTQIVESYAWWEILPDSETPIPLTVAPGDRITVTIGQMSVGLWNISIIDDTTGEAFATKRAYSGAGGSADWIVEAPTSTINGIIDTLGQYTEVTFSNLGVTGPAASLFNWGMVQGGVVVSVPSALTATGFNAAYGAVSPAAPG